MKPLYPALEANTVHRLPVTDGHCLHLEEYGNPSGIPVLFLHGGPGSGCKPLHSRFFNPAHYRVILLDQRGAGRSTPVGDLKANTTRHLIVDLEQIREYLMIERWVLFAGSWGATLALLYAQDFPERVLAMILRGVFLARQQDMDWYLREGANRIYPEAWQALLAAVPATEQHDLIAYLYQCLSSDNDNARYRAARAWTRWGDTLALGDPQLSEDSYPCFQPKTGIELHYAYHRFFIEDQQILRHCNRIQQIPTHIIHGRQDRVCTPEAALTLHQHLPQSTLTFLPNGGHIAQGADMIDALITATDNFAEQLA